METPAQMYRRRAAEYRKEAELEREYGVKEALLKIAESYDGLADQAEGRPPKKP